MASLKEYKSSVFSLLMEDPRNCLEVYNALNDSNYDNPDEVEINRLENGIALSIMNDASFIIDMSARNLQDIIEEIKGIADSFTEFIGALTEKISTIQTASEQNEVGVEEIVRKIESTNIIAERLHNISTSNLANVDRMSEVIDKFSL